VIDPKDSAAYTNRGHSKHKLNDTVGEIADYTDALLIDSEDEIAWFNRGMARFKLHDYSGAISDLTQAIGFDPNDATAYYYSSIAKYNQKDFYGVVSDIIKALEINPEIGEFNWIDDSSSQEINIDILNIVEYTKDITNYPLDIKTFIKRAWLRSSIHDYAGAISDYNRIIEIDPKNSSAYFSRGYIKHYTFGDYIGAISDYDDAIKNAPDNAEVISFRGNAKYSLNDYQGAIVDFTTIINLEHPEVPNELEDLEHYIEFAYFDRANSKRDLHDYIGAIEDYTMATKIDNTFFGHYSSRGDVKINIQDYTGAIEDYTIAIKLDAKDAESYYSRGLAKIHLGHVGVGYLDLKKAGELGHEKAYEAIKHYCQ